MLSRAQYGQKKGKMKNQTANIPINYDFNKIHDLWEWFKNCQQPCKGLFYNAFLLVFQKKLKNNFWSFLLIQSDIKLLMTSTFAMGLF